MDIEFENGMQKLLHAHMEDARKHFAIYKEYPLRAFIYNGYDFTPHKIDSSHLNEEMSSIRDKACASNATAVTMIGVFNLSYAEGDTHDDAVRKLKENSETHFTVLAVIMKFMDGKTFSLMHEIKEENGEKTLDEAVYVENQQFFDIPIKPWGN